MFGVLVFFLSMCFTLCSLIAVSSSLLICVVQFSISPIQCPFHLTPCNSISSTFGCCLAWLSVPESVEISPAPSPGSVTVSLCPLFSSWTGFSAPLQAQSPVIGCQVLGFTVLGDGAVVPVCVRVLYSGI